MASHGLLCLCPSHCCLDETAQMDAQWCFVQFMEQVEVADAANPCFMGGSAPQCCLEHTCIMWLRYVGSLIGWPCRGLLQSQACHWRRPRLRSSKLQQMQQVVHWGPLQLAAWSRLCLQVCTLQCCAVQGRTGPPTCFKLQALDLLRSAGILGQLT